jgi:hypothetical protein
VKQFILSTKVSIGVCATLGIGPFTLQLCNPTALPWLPVTILNGPKYDFSRFCWIIHTRYCYNNILVIVTSTLYTNFIYIGRIIPSFTVGVFQ